MVAQISLIVAYCVKTRVIGYRNSLPWPRLASDIHRFAQLTAGTAVIMGRRTFESQEVGSRSLPGRRTIVMTSREITGVETAKSYEEAIVLAGKAPIYIVGGEAVYRAALDAHVPFSCRHIYATEIAGPWPGNARFPLLGSEWKVVPAEWKEIIKENGVQYRFVNYQRTT